MYKEFKNFILNLYNDFVRKGETKEDSLALVVYIIKSTLMLDKLQPIHYGKKEDFALFEKGNKYYFENLEKVQKFKVLKFEQIKKAVLDLVSNLDDIYSSDKKRTNSFTAKLIQNIIMSIDKNKTVIDLSVGKGTLLENLSNPREGQDIDLRQVIISEFSLSKYNEIKNIIVGDSLEDTNIFKKNNDSIYVFDPPMGDLRTYPNDIKWQNTDIIEKEKPARLQSEVLFLMSFLLNAKDDDYFIGLFPENILNKNNKEYNSLRKYLIENSLISIIKVLTNHVLLIGQKKLTQDRYNKIPVLNITSTLNDEQLQFIGKEIAKKKDFNFEQFYKIFPDDYGTVIKDIGIESFNKDWSQIFAYKIYNRDELIKDNQNIMIPVIKSYEEKHIATPKELIELIKKDEIDIKNNVEKLDIIVQNLSNLETKVKEDKQWFEEDFTEETQSLAFFKNYFNNECVIKNINAPELYKHFKILYFKNRIKFNRNKFVINYDEHIEVSDLQETTLYKKFNPLLDKEICSVINMIPNDTNIKAVFEDICRYWMLNQDEEKTIVNQKTMKSAELKRCLSVLNNLGLLIYNKNKVRYYDEEKSEINLYKSYIPNIKYLDALRFKEMQDVQ